MCKRLIYLTNGCKVSASTKWNQDLQTQKYDERLNNNSKFIFIKIVILEKNTNLLRVKTGLGRTAKTWD